MSDTPKEGTIVDDFDFLANELANLLVASDFDEETQKTLLLALPHLTLKEIVDLVGALEAKYVVGETTKLDTQLKNNLGRISSNYAAKEESMEADTIKKLEALADSI